MIKTIINAIDVRGWATIGMFAMVFYILHLVASHPELVTNELFKTLATLLVGSGGFGLVSTFLWGGTKSSAGAVEAVTAMSIGAANASNGQPTVTTGNPATVQTPIDAPKTP